MNGTGDYLLTFHNPPIPPGLNKPNYLCNYYAEPGKVAEIANLFTTNEISGIYAQHSAAMLIAQKVAELEQSGVHIDALNLHSLWPSVVAEIAPQFQESKDRVELEPTLLAGDHRIVVWTTAEKEILVNLAEQKRLVAGGSDEMRQRVRVTPIGVRIEDFLYAPQERHDLRKQYFDGISNHDVIFYTPTGIVSYKGLMEVVTAFGAVAEEQDDIYYLLAGGPIEKNQFFDDMMKRIRTFPQHVQNRMRFPGRLPQLAAHASGDVEIVASSKESGSLVTIEAGAAHKPTILSNIPTMLEIAGVPGVETNLNPGSGRPLVFNRPGSVYSPDEIHRTLARAIEIAATDEQWRRHCGVFNYQNALAHSWDETAQAYIGYTGLQNELF